ncbi:MAG: GNAT family N-acetyltransferase [Hyphomicrobiaceae bacterium]
MLTTTPADMPTPDLDPAMRRDTADPTYRLSFHESPDMVADLWREFERSATATLFQSYRWVDAWCRTVAPVTGEEPLIVVGRDGSGETAFIWPMAVTRRAGIRVLTWLGQEHANYNMGLYAPGVAALIGVNDLWRMISEIAASRPGIAAVSFSSQPLHWHGIANPFAELPRQASANSSWLLPLEGSFASLYEARIGRTTRQTLRRKERKLAELEGYAVARAVSTADRLDLFEAFREQKAVQLAAQGTPNVFERPEIAAFYADLAETEREGGALIDCTGLTVGSDIIAVASGARFQDRFYLLTTSIAMGEHQRWSPGLVVMKEQIADACAAGAGLYDFGTGDGAHKLTWGPDNFALFDTYVPLRTAGYAVTWLGRSRAFAKRVVKSNDRLWQLARTTRRMLGRLGARRQPNAAVAPSTPEHRRHFGIALAMLLSC